MLTQNSHSKQYISSTAITHTINNSIAALTKNKQLTTDDDEWQMKCITIVFVIFEFIVCNLLERIFVSCVNWTKSMELTKYLSISFVEKAYQSGIFRRETDTKPCDSTNRFSHAHKMH